jgi:molybdopterin biosynthesis enzyme
MGVAASLGLAWLLVRQRPRVAILSRAMKQPGGERAPAQIYDANRFTLRGWSRGPGAATDCGII